MIPARLRQFNPALSATIEKNGGFITDDMLPELIRIDRLMLILVRCGNGRFLCPAQDVAHFISIVEVSKKDHVRDVSLPA